MKATEPADYLSQISLLRLIAVMALVLSPHFITIPAWCALLVLAVLGWRAAAALRQWRLPPATWRAALAIGAFVGVYLDYGRTTGQFVGTALLVVMLSLKLTEMRTRRDVMLVVFLMYFVMLTHFLASQEIWTIAYLLACAVAVTAVLVEVNHPGAPLSPRITLALGGRMVVHGLPLMVVFFILFPRLPGPLWGLPSSTGNARSGLSDSMEPGGIAKLIPSDEVAFRAYFIDTVPLPHDRYWRGPVLWNFDGRKWDRGFRGNDFRPPQVELQEPGVRYRVMLEPQESTWLLALELPEAIGIPRGSRFTNDYQLVSQRPIRDRVMYTLVSHPRYRLLSDMDEREQRLNTFMPPGSNPRTVAWAQQLRAQGLTDQQMIDAVLKYFREQEFYYTLEPPLVGANSADDFLFDTRRGFCEHYSSSFTAVMRAAGIPARVVTGYLGGEMNAIGGYLVVRQSDAHAWSEVWLGREQGWVRVDPTAAVAPSRIEQGLDEALGRGLAAAGEGMSFTRLKFWVEARWEFLNARWNEWVLGFGPELQRDFLSRFGIDDMRKMLIALTVFVTLGLVLTGMVTLRRMAPAKPTEAALIEWRRLQARLARAGITIRADEGPLDFAARAAAERPELALPVTAAAQAYARLRYLGEPDAAAQRTLEEAVRAVRT